METTTQMRRRADKSIAQPHGDRSLHEFERLAEYHQPAEPEVAAAVIVVRIPVRTNGRSRFEMRAVLAGEPKPIGLGLTNQAIVDGAFQARFKGMAARAARAESRN